MSLLLEALKKAEKAKEEAQRRAAAESPPSTPLELAKEEPAPAEPAKRVMTRSELPDINSQPLEILSDDIAPKATAAEPRAAPGPSPAAAAAARAQAAREPAAEPKQRAARKVFEAKYKETNPRLPFYVTVGALVAFGIGYAGYVWWQMRPPSPLVSANPKAAGERPGAAAPVPAPASNPASQAPRAATGAITGLPGATVVQGPGPAAPSTPSAPASASASPSASVPAEPARTVKSQPAVPAPRAAERGAPAGARVSRPAPPRVHPRVAAAYTAYLGGDLNAAREDYQQALRDEPGNRDALLGIAAIEARSGRVAAAEAAYLRILQADPRDAHAQAGLIALRAGRIDPLAAEGRVKTLIAAEPGEPVLYFTLGNQLAQQGRWSEAQQQYFRAFAADPENADFAYNLAVSLDHLRQPKLALEYYERAINLSGTRAASFDVAAARERAARLAR